MSDGPKTVGVRLRSDRLDALDRYASANRLSRSDALRQAVDLLDRHAPETDDDVNVIVGGSVPDSADQLDAESIEAARNGLRGRFKRPPSDDQDDDTPPGGTRPSSRVD